eukprot:573792-Hanusia_phi.AAC.1
MQVIPLPFITEDAKIRHTHTNPQLISVIDMIMSVCETNRQYAAKIFQRLTDAGWTKKCQLWKFSGERQRETPVCNFDNILIIMQHLPGKIAARNREKTAETIRRYFAGDQTLHDETMQVIPLPSSTDEQLEQAKLEVSRNQRIDVNNVHHLNTLPIHERIFFYNLSGLSGAKKRQPKPDGYIYVVQQQSGIGSKSFKVGRTINVHSRMYAYGRNCSVYYLHKIPGNIISSVERKALRNTHKKFKVVQGNEWFETDDVDKLIDCVHRTIQLCLRAQQ